jgi:hypothetical protein
MEIGFDAVIRVAKALKTIVGGEIIFDGNPGNQLKVELTKYLAEPKNAQVNGENAD